MNIGVDCPKPPSLIVLTAGREAFLEENLLSIKRQTLPPPMVVLVNDGPPLTARLEAMAVQSAVQVRILQTESPGSGQWNAFRLGLMGLKNTTPFSIIHDDDRLKPDYVETLTKFGAGRTTPWICSHNLEVFSNDQEQPYLILPKESQAFVLNNQGEVCLRYSRSFIPFPGTCFGISPTEVACHLKPEYHEMADLVLLCECATRAKVFFEPRPIYEYRRHTGQVSGNMGHAMEDQVQNYLLGASQGTPVQPQVKNNLEQRRAERFFSWAWNSKTFRNYPHQKQFHWSRTIRCIRNRKLLFAEICFRDFLKRISNHLLKLQNTA